MYIKLLKYFIFIILIFIINIRITYSYKLNNKIYYTNINITDYKRLLKIKNNVNLCYYRKNNICVEVKLLALHQFVEIPDENGNIKRHISEFYRYCFFRRIYPHGYMICTHRFGINSLVNILDDCLLKNLENGQKRGLGFLAY
ncbi:hypothetical protein H8356DRAFT_1361378 [Neocallimastix lanati (nom. inval.)]|nr:hypothetical protein H8356DRAFT_1361378 [Neocallimastix sp. JGI-2020a]